MKAIQISDEAYDRLVLAAKIAGISVPDAVDRLVGIPPRPEPTGAAEAGGRELAVYVVYRGTKVSGVLDLDSERLRITDAPVAGLAGSYRTPSNAAVETVRALNPDRQHPETNGWRFWYAEDGQLIDRHRRRRP